MLDPELLIGDAPIGSGFNAAVVSHGRPLGDAASVAAAVLRVHAGPDAGREFPLAPRSTA